MPSSPKKNTYKKPKMGVSHDRKALKERMKILEKTLPDFGSHY
jgi:hypothetical protein